MDMKDKISLKDMCQKIADSGILKRKDGTKPTDQEVFNKLYYPDENVKSILDTYKLVLLTEIGKQPTQKRKPVRDAKNKVKTKK
jgi:hypothetical protein